MLFSRQSDLRNLDKLHLHLGIFPSFCFRNLFNYAYTYTLKCFELEMTLEKFPR